MTWAWMRTANWKAFVEAIWMDVRYAARGLRRNPGFAAVAVATLALGIGANTAMFSIVHAVMLRPLPYRDAAQLVLLWTDDEKRGLHTEKTAALTIADWRSANLTLEDIAYYSVQRATLTGASGREHSRSAFVSGTLFPLLGVHALRGRTLTAADAAAPSPAAIISHELWQRRFGGSADALGATIALEAPDRNEPEIFQIVGIMPASFAFPDKQTEIWIPASPDRLSREANERFESWARRWTAIGRLKPHMSATDAQNDLRRVGARLASQYVTGTADFPGFSVNVVPLLDSITGKNLQRALWLLLGAVFLVLLVACTNVANLLLARGAGRQQEFALRRALGAGDGRLVRQLAAESLVLAGLGGTAGVLLAQFSMRLLTIVAASRVPRLDEASLDAPVLLFAAAVSLLTAIVFGAAPALRTAGGTTADALREYGRTTSGTSVLRTRGLLIIAECAIAVVLLVAAGLLWRSLGQLRAVNPGFDASHVLSMRLEFPPEPGPAGTDASADADRTLARVQRIGDLEARLAAIPGVQSVGFADDMFVAGQGHGVVVTVFGSGSRDIPSPLNDAKVSPAFFDVLRVSLRQGRALTRDDALATIRVSSPAPVEVFTPAGAMHVAGRVVVNESFARRFFPGSDPIGRRFSVESTKTISYEIVGVVNDMHRQGLDRSAIPEYYTSWIPAPGARADLLVRMEDDPLALAPTVRQTVSSALPGVLIGAVSTADRDLDTFNAERVFQTRLLLAFAALAFTMTIVGVYGIVQYAMAQRTREIGVRLAFGAAAGDVLRMAVWQGMRLPLIGLGIGTVVAFAVTPAMATLLFGVSSADPVTYLGVVTILGGAALLACLVPAVRASHLDPLCALRHE